MRKWLSQAILQTEINGWTLLGRKHYITPQYPPADNDLFNMDYDKFLGNFTSAIEGIESENVSLDSKLHSLKAWDSLAILNILAMVDCEYSVQISGIEINAAVTVRDIAKLVEQKL